MSANNSSGSGPALRGARGGNIIPPATFGSDVSFLARHTELVMLSDQAGAAGVAIAPAWQGRVMTSTAAGDAGRSHGWINRTLIASGKRLPHINVFGGEDRFWMGPEAGPYSLFFAPGAPFDLTHWFTPPPLDTEAFALVGKSRTHARFQRTFALTNYAGTVFNVKVDREVRLLSPRTAWRRLGCRPPNGLKLVAFESDNRVTNAGKRAWRKNTGLVSIWILGMFPPSPATTIVVPIKTGPESRLGPAVTSDYFGEVPADRLVVKDGLVFFCGDGRCRSKIGVSPRRCQSILGSYDAVGRVLTLVQFSYRQSVADYVNSQWKLRADPYRGDAVNSYNDGPPGRGKKPLGPFYELESSSSAAALMPGEALRHVHRTIHFSGDASSLDAVARATLGVGLCEIENALPKR